MNKHKTRTIVRVIFFFQKHTRVRRLHHDSYAKKGRNILPLVVEYLKKGMKTRDRKGM